MLLCLLQRFQGVDVLLKEIMINRVYYYPWYLLSMSGALG